MTAAGNWAVERGVSNAALADWNPATPAVAALIAARRTAADEVFAAALADIESGAPFLGRDDLVAGVEAAHVTVVDLLAKVDHDIGQPKITRGPGAQKEWIPAATALIMLSQNLRLAAQYLPHTIQTQILLAQDVRHAVWTMSEYAGRERAIVGGLVTGGTKMSTEVLQRLNGLRGRVEQAWKAVDVYLRKDLAAPEIVVAAAAVKSSFFGTFEEVRQQVYAAGIQGSDYPLSGDEWIAKAIAGIDSLLALAKDASTASGRLAGDSHGESVRSMTLNAGILAAAALLAALAFWIVLGRVVGPIDRLTRGMRALADGDIELPSGDGGDEIASMARSVEVFQQNAREVRRLEVEQKQTAELAESEKRRAMNELADGFEASVRGVVGAVSGAAEELQSTAGSMSATAEKATASEELSASISEINENAASIAAAVEQQNAATNEISRNVQEASSGTEEVSRNTSGLSEASRATGAAASQVLEASGGLARDAQRLAGEVDTFIARVRAS